MDITSLSYSESATYTADTNNICQSSEVLSLTILDKPLTDIDQANLKLYALNPSTTYKLLDCDEDTILNEE